MSRRADDIIDCRARFWLDFGARERLPGIVSNAMGSQLECRAAARDVIDDGLRASLSSPDD